MFLYILLNEVHKNILDTKAAVDLLKEVYKAEYRGFIFRPVVGIIYATTTAVIEDDQFVLGLIPWE